MDLEYARRLSLWFDLWLLLQTALITVRLRGSV
jgi:lipopolysaccharide/colanic/teichoic acid biosynthesis glycosyltransferase